MQLSVNPTGLGAAAAFAVLGTGGGQVSLNDATIVGDIGLGAKETGHFRDTSVTGTLWFDLAARADVSHLRHGFTVSGGVTTTNLASAVQDADAASAAYAALPATQTFGNVTKSLMVTGNGGTNVIAIHALDYRDKTLTLTGGANDVFIFNVAAGFTFTQSKIQLNGGVTADHVLFNIATKGADVELAGASSVINGTFLAPHREVIYKGHATFNGAIDARDVDIHDRGVVHFVGFHIPVAPAKLSGYEYIDNDRSGTMNAGDAGLAGVTITLTGVNDLGANVSLTATTDSNGFYQFLGLRPGTYTIAQSPPFSYRDETANIGTLGGSRNANTIGAIVVHAGDAGSGYDFAETFRTIAV